MNLHDKKPSRYDDDISICSLGGWAITQVKNYEKKSNIMGSNESIYTIWHNFMNTEHYKNHFISNNDLFDANFNKLKQFINDNKNYDRKI